MQSHELLREVFQQANPKAAAAELGLSLSMIYKWTEPPNQKSGAANPLDRVEQLIGSTKDPRIIQWLCQRAGGYYIKNPRHSSAHPASLVPAMNEVVQEFADLLSVVAAAASDNQITQTEAAAIRVRWEKLKSVTEGFVQCCEEGNFRPIKKTASPEKTMASMIAASHRMAETESRSAAAPRA